MNIADAAKILNILTYHDDSIKKSTFRESSMIFKVHYEKGLFKEKRLCGIFNSLGHAMIHVDFLQKRLPNGNKIVFKITGNPVNTGL